MAAILKKKSWYRDYLLIFLGTALMSVALNSAFEPNGLVDGGFSGIAIIIKNITEGLVDGGVPLWITNIVLNIPMFFLGIRIKGVRFLAKTIWGTLSLSFWLAVMPVIPLVEGEMVLAVKAYVHCAHYADCGCAHCGYRRFCIRTQDCAVRYCSYFYRGEGNGRSYGGDELC